MGLNEDWEKNTVHLMGAAENFNRRSAFVQYSTDELIKNHFIQHHSKANAQSFIYAKYKQPQSIYPIGTSTIQITTYSTNKSPIHKAPDSLIVSHSEIKRSLFPALPSTGHSARSRRRSRRIQQTILPADPHCGEAAM